MVKSDKKESIQAFPMGLHTYRGILTDFDRNNYHVVHCLEDTSLTVSDGTNTNTVAIPAVSDVALTPDIQLVTTDVEVIIG